MADVVHRGTLTRERLEVLAKEHGFFTVKTDDYNPHTNHNAISIVRQPDGNWIGEGFFHGRIQRMRTSDPQTVLIGLITGQGE